MYHCYSMRFESKPRGVRDALRASLPCRTNLVIFSNREQAVHSSWRSALPVEIIERTWRSTPSRSHMQISLRWRSSQKITALTGDQLCRWRSPTAHGDQLEVEIISGDHRFDRRSARPVEITDRTVSVPGWWEWLDWTPGSSGDQFQLEITSGDHRSDLEISIIRFFCNFGRFRALRRPMTS